MCPGHIDCPWPLKTTVKVRKEKEVLLLLWILYSSGLIFLTPEVGMLSNPLWEYDWTVFSLSVTWSCSRCSMCISYTVFVSVPRGITRVLQTSWNHLCGPRLRQGRKPRQGKDWRKSHHSTVRFPKLWLTVDPTAVLALGVGWKPITLLSPYISGPAFGEGI